MFILRCRVWLKLSHCLRGHRLVSVVLEVFVVAMAPLDPVVAVVLVSTILVFVVGVLVGVLGVYSLGRLASWGRVGLSYGWREVAS